MKAEKKGSDLVLTLPLMTPQPSASGKTLVVATTSGPQKTDVKIDGRTVTVVLTAYIPKE